MQNLETWAFSNFLTNSSTDASSVYLYIHLNIEYFSFRNDYIMKSITGGSWIGWQNPQKTSVG